MTRHSKRRLLKALSLRKILATADLQACSQQRSLSSLVSTSKGASWCCDLSCRLAVHSIPIKPIEAPRWVLVLPFSTISQGIANFWCESLPLKQNPMKESCQTNSQKPKCLFQVLTQYFYTDLEAILLLKVDTNNQTLRLIGLAPQNVSLFAHHKALYQSPYT